MCEKQLTNMSWNILWVESLSMHKTKCFADLIRLGASRKRTPTSDSFLDFLHFQHALDVKKNEGQSPSAVRRHGKWGGGLAAGGDPLLMQSPWGCTQTVPGLLMKPFNWHEQRRVYGSHLLGAGAQTGAWGLWDHTKCFSLEDCVATKARRERTVARNLRESSQPSPGSQRWASFQDTRTNLVGSKVLTSVSYSSLEVTNLC